MRDFEQNNENTNQKAANLPLLACTASYAYYDKKKFEIIYCQSTIKISLDDANYAVITLKNQKVIDGETELGGFTPSVSSAGDIDYNHYFDIQWPEANSVPELVFFQRPDKIERYYDKQGKIELGIEKVSTYHVKYQDGVTADFVRNSTGKYTFSFSTGFAGSFMKEKDGSHTIRFKALPKDADEGVYLSESKFIITRSKYTNNLILILQDKAVVSLVQ